MIKHTTAFYKKKTIHFIIAAFRYTMIICLSYMILNPLLSQITLAIRSPYDLGIPSALWVPNSFSTEHIGIAFRILNYVKALPYTLFVTTILMILQTFTAALCGYAFARLKFKGSSILFTCVLMTIIIPPQTLMLPQYIYFRNFDILGLFQLFTGNPINLLDTPITLFILAFTGMGIKSGLYIYIFKQFIRGVPKEIEEAAFVDGAGFLKTFFKIVLPSAKSGIITVAVLSFVWNWNDSYYSSLFNPTNLNLTIGLKRALADLTPTLNAIQNTIPGDYVFLRENLLYENAVSQTASFFVILPLIILYLFIQKQFVQGVERSGIVG